MVKIGPMAVIAAGGVIMVLFLFAKKQAKQTVAEIAKAIDPTKKENVVNKYFTKAYKAVTGSEQMMGEDIYDWLHPRHPAKEKTEVDIATESEVAPPAAGSGGKWLVPEGPYYVPPAKAEAGGSLWIPPSPYAEEYELIMFD